MSVCCYTFHNEYLKQGRYLRNWSDQTLATYGASLASLAKFTEGGVPTQAQLQSWVMAMRERGCTPGGCNVRIRAVNSFLVWLKAQGHEHVPPVLRELKAPIKVIHTLSKADIHALLAFKPRHSGERRARALALTLLDTGCRLREILTATRDHLDLDGLTLIVDGKGSKQRFVLFSPELRKELFKQLQRSKGRLIFGTRNDTPLTSRNAQRDIARICKAAGITQHIHPHALRHSFACNYINAGGNVYKLSRLLGHAGVTITQTYLRSMSIEDMKEGHDKLSPLSI